MIDCSKHNVPCDWFVWLKIKKNMSNDNQHCDKMIAELVNRMENLSLIKTENPKKNSRIIYPNKNDCNITSIYEFKKPNKSKLETYINILLKDILKDYNYTLYWSVRLNEYKRTI